MDAIWLWCGEYNRKVKFRAALAVATLLITLLGACARRNDTPEAVKQGIIRDISKKLDVASMDVNVDSVSFRDKEADATVSFTVKGGSRSNAMVMKYVMERHDDNQWYIKQPSGRRTGGWR